MDAKRTSPALKPGAYGKPQRWHQIIMDKAEERTAKDTERRRRTMEYALAISLGAATIGAAVIGLAHL